MMQALVLSFLQPPRPGVDVHGTYTRLALHVRALHAIGAAIEIAYFVTEEDVPRSVCLDEAARTQEPAEAAYWGFPAKVHLIRRRERAQSFANHYLHGILSAADQPAMMRWAGPAQAEAVGAILDRRHDIVVVNNLHAGCALLRSGRRPARLFFDLDDVQHLVRLRWIGQGLHEPGRLLMLSHIPALIAAERALARAAEASFVCSEADRDQLVRLGLPRVSVVPNALPIPPAAIEPAGEPTLLFVGSLRHTPNKEAAERMVRRIFPLIRARHPAARLLIAGMGSEALPSRADHPAGVDYLGFVPDIAALYRRAAVFVCPMRNGGGTRIKLLDAAGHGLAIVSTRMGASGLRLQDGRDLLLRDSDEAFAAACVGLLADPVAARRLGAAARTVICTHYDAAVIESRLQTRYATAPPRMSNGG